MPQFSDEDPMAKVGLLNGVADVYGGAPIANVFTPGVQAVYQRYQENQLRNQQGRNAQNIETPEYSSDANIKAQYSGDFTPEMYRTPEEAQYSLAQD